MMTTKPVDYNSLTLRGCGGGGGTHMIASPPSCSTDPELSLPTPLQPEQFDWAINDRIDEMVEFSLPGCAQSPSSLRQRNRPNSLPAGATSANA